MSRLEHIAFVDALDRVAHILEEDFNVVRHVVGDGHHLDGAGATFGAEGQIIVGAGSTEDMAAVGEEEGWHGSDGVEVFRLHHATRAMKPIHIEIKKFQSRRKITVVGVSCR